MSPATLQPPGFQTRARDALGAARAAIAGLILPLVGKGSPRAAELVEVLGLDPRLAWKISKIIECSDDLAVVRYLPGARAVRLLARAAARRDAPPAALDRLTEAFTALDRFVDREAGDRASFRMMVSDHARSLRLDASLEHRKGAFDHNGYVWGVQAALQIHTYLIRPSADRKHLDAATVRGFVGLRRVRPGPPWRISRFITIDDAGAVRSDFSRAPIAPDCAPGDVPLLRQFSTPDAPVRRVAGPRGVIDDVLAEGDVGNTRSVTCLTGEIIHTPDPCYPDERHRGLGTKAVLRTPCRAVLYDLFLDRTFFGQVEPAARLVSDLFVETIGSTYTEADRLPLSESVSALGAAGRAPPVSDLPAYPDMIAYCFERLGWAPQDFDCYRLLVPFPPMPAALLVDCPLPPGP